MKKDNMLFLPVNKTLFNESLVTCRGIVTGAGFETPAEALHLGKKILALPTKGQYEQLCNAAALQQIGVTCLKKIDDKFPFIFNQWLNEKTNYGINYTKTIPLLMERLFAFYDGMRNSFEEDMPDTLITLPELFALRMSRQL